MVAAFEDRALPASLRRSVNAARIFPKGAEVKIPSSAAQFVAESCGFFGGLRCGRGTELIAGGVMVALDRRCSGMSSACCLSR